MKSGNILRITNLEDYRPNKFGRFTDAPIWSFADLIFRKTKKKVWIFYSVNIADCIVWNHNICIAETKICNKNVTIDSESKKNYLPSSYKEPPRETTEPPSRWKHHRLPPRETPSCAKRWSSVAVERACNLSMCKGKRKSRVWVLCAF